MSTFLQPIHQRNSLHLRTAMGALEWKTGEEKFHMLILSFSSSIVDHVFA